MRRGFARVSGNERRALTTVFPEPMDLIVPLLEALKKRNVRATIAQSIC